jgi:hypothetical protein
MVLKVERNVLPSFRVWKKTDFRESWERGNVNLFFPYNNNTFVRAEAEGKPAYSAHSSLARFLFLLWAGLPAARGCLHRKLSVPSSLGLLCLFPPVRRRCAAGNGKHASWPAHLRPFAASCSCKAICRARHRRGSRARAHHDQSTYS